MRMAIGFIFGLICGSSFGLMISFALWEKLNSR